MEKKKQKSGMKRLVLDRMFRTAFLQPVWERVHGISVLAMNFWGGARFETSGELHVLEHVVRPMMQYGVVFDVGANDGRYALAARRLLGPAARLYCFEPSKTTFERLRENVAATGGIHPFQCGFSDREASLILHHADASALSSLYADNPLTTFTATEPIVLTTVSAFCSAEGIDGIDFLKVDVEGHEHKVLVGASDMLASRRIRCIQFEIGECSIASRTFFRDFYELLHRDYMLYRVLPRGLRAITSYSTLHEIFACVNYLAVVKDDSRR